MTMRKREEIEESTEYPIEHFNESPYYALTQLQLLQLEVLLDIRDLLTPVHSEPANLSDTPGYRRWEEIRK